MIDLYEQFGVANEATSEEILGAIELARSNLTDDKESLGRTEILQQTNSLNFAERVLLSELNRRDYDRALAIVSDSWQNTRTADDLVDAAWSLVSDESGIAEAIALAERATQADPSNVRALTLLAQASQLWGQLEDALRASKRSVQLAGQDTKALSVLASIYREKEQYAEAIRVFERGFALDQKMADAFGLDYCICLWSTGQHEKAIVFLQVLRERDPGKQKLKDALATSYCLLIPRQWTQVSEQNEQGAPAGSYITTRAQAKNSIALLEKVRSLDISDEATSAEIKEVGEIVVRAVERRLHGSIVSTIFGGFIWAFLYGVGFMLAPAYFYTARAPGYLINRDELAGKVSGDLEVSGQQGMDKVLAYAINGLFLPILVVKSYINNFTGEQKDIESLIKICRAAVHQK